jgi:hypothetical protein
MKEGKNLFCVIFSSLSSSINAFLDIYSLIIPASMIYSFLHLTRVERKEEVREGEDEWHIIAFSA